MLLQRQKGAAWEPLECLQSEGRLPKICVSIVLLDYFVFTSDHQTLQNIKNGQRVFCLNACFTSEHQTFQPI